MIKPQTLKGFRDFLPQEKRKRQYVINQLTSVFESFGFEPLETPSLEYEEILTGKYGEEGDKLMYRFEDNGKRRVAMRYDQTVPLARVVAQYQNELPIPFKRYQIQPVWRAENTQKGRYREFLQCDIDTVGSSSPLADAEIIATAAKGLEALGFKDYKILINDRDVFDELAKLARERFPNRLKEQLEMFIAVPQALDKLKKIGNEGVIEELIKKGFEEEEAKYIMAIVGNQKPTEKLEKIFDLLKKFDISNDQYKFDSTLARGLSYYTSTIFEVEIEGYTAGSVCGGGRYDNLIGMFMFANQKIPAVGCAFGFDRIIEAMDALNLFPDELTNSSTKILVTIFSEELKQKSLEIATQLRGQNINTEIYLGEIKDKNPLEKQLKYADQKQIPYVAIIGPEEIESDSITVKNLQTRTQEKTTIEDLVKRIMK